MEVDETNRPISKCVQRVCHDTLPWLISVSLDGYAALPITRHMKLTLAILALVTLCVACTSSAVEEKKLLGSWELDIGVGMKAIVTYSADHTFVVSFRGIVTGSATGTWRIEGDKLITKTKTNTTNKDKEGQEDTNTIVNLGDEILVMKESETAVYSYKRLK